VKLKNGLTKEGSNEVDIFSQCFDILIFDTFDIDILPHHQFEKLNLVRGKKSKMKMIGKLSKGISEPLYCIFQKTVLGDFGGQC
jgi:hypothetical protein